MILLLVRTPTVPWLRPLFSGCVWYVFAIGVKTSREKSFQLGASGGGGVEWRSEERKTMRDQADKGWARTGSGGKGYPL
jgi:hypothetical protein